MKKILLYSTLTLSMGLFSCSQEDLMEQGNISQSGKPVTVSVQLPDEVGSDAASRALPAIPDGHQLRCILYVSGDGETPIRQETVVTDASGIISFTFTPVTDDYTCSFWADFVSGTDTNADGRYYDDLYYNTENLPDVTYSSSLPEGYSFFNNDACDAFTGHFAANDLTNGTVTLKRPFAKVNFVEKVSDVSGTIAVKGYVVNNGMNITNGTINPETTELPYYSGAVADGGQKIYFFNYLFADGTNTKLPASISLMVNDGNETSISTDEMMLNANTLYNLSLTANVGEVVTSPKVGDYFYTDGTWSTAYTGEKMIAGVVFAVKGDGTNCTIKSDVVDNYSEDVSGALDVLAWVVAVKDAGNGLGFFNGATAKLPEGVGSDANDIKGFSNTNQWYTQSSTEYVAVATAKSYSVTITGEILNSGWYLPSAGQLSALVGVYAEDNSKNQGNALAVKTSLQSLVDASVTEAALMTNGYYWASSGDTNNSSVRAYRVGFHEATYYGNIGPNSNLTSGSNVRPVLTIFTATEQQ